MDPQYFQTWSLLQAHIRTVHPPTCPHPGCEDKKFASQKNFKAHLKVHEERDIQGGLEDAMDCDGSHDEYDEVFSRTIEVGRDWKCGWEGCEKAFKSVSWCV
jgi:general transcription factor IIIA